MSGFWHPLSAVYLDHPRVLASPAVLRLMLAGEGRADVVYAGDRMWPAIRHGQVLTVVPFAFASAKAGDVVLAIDGGIPDLWRLTLSSDALSVSADADPTPARPVTPRDVVGRIESVPGRRFGRGARVWLDVHEAVACGPDTIDDPAQTVRDKYDDQAVHYDRSGHDGIEPRLVSRIRESVPRGARILVAGSGAGREAFALEGIGYEVTGVDFSQRMVAHAQAEAVRRGSSATFLHADLRSHREAEASFGAVVFTYDVFSFVPGRRDREALLQRVARWLGPDGVLFLSARRVLRAWDRAVLSLQWLARTSRGRRGAWGDSHTRWLDTSGRLRRSFVHVFTDRGLDREARAARLRRVSWEGGHGQFVARAEIGAGRRA